MTNAVNRVCKSQADVNKIASRDACLPIKRMSPRPHQA